MDKRERCVGPMVHIQTSTHLERGIEKEFQSPIIDTTLLLQYARLKPLHAICSQLDTCISIAMGIAST